MSPPRLLADNIPYTHGFFTREGGVSTGIYASLQCGAGAADMAQNVAQNRALVLAALGLTSLVTCYQSHSAVALTVSSSFDTPPSADALVTATPGLALGILTADCAPVLFADPVAGVIGAAHAGWRGAVSGVLEATLEQMWSLGATPANIQASIGPCIQQESYEVGPEFTEIFAQTHPEWFEHGVVEAFLDKDLGTGRLMFDLPTYIRMRLLHADIEALHDLAIDTYTDTRFFSHRRAKHAGEVDYGRQISVIALA